MNRAKRYFEQPDHSAFLDGNSRSDLSDSPVPGRRSRHWGETLRSCLPFLKQIAARLLRGGTLERQLVPQDLIHDAWLTRICSRPVAINDRGHYLALLTLAMKREWIDNVRRTKSLKRTSPVWRWKRSIQGRRWSSGCVIAQLPPVTPGAPLQYVRSFDRASAPLGVRAISGDSEGFLRVGSDSGLFRFDGIHFHEISPKPVRPRKNHQRWLGAGERAGGSDRLPQRRNTIHPDYRHRRIGVARERNHRVKRCDLDGLHLRRKAHGNLSQRNAFCRWVRAVWFGCGRQILFALGWRRDSPLRPR